MLRLHAGLTLRLITLMLGLSASLAAVAVAEPALQSVDVSSPDGDITASLSLDGNARPVYHIDFHGAPVIADSRLGLLFTDAPKLQRGLAITGVERGSADQTWEQPWGQWQHVRDQHNTLTVHLAETDHLKRRLDVVFKVFDGGVGYRLVLPEQRGMKRVHLAEELSEFALASQGQALWIPAGESNRYEYRYQNTPVSEVSVAHTPITARLAGGTHVSLHEAALVDYSAMWLKRVTGTTFRSVLAPGSGEAKVVTDLPMATPWRTITITDDAPELYTQASQMELNLNAPNALGDVSWITPGRFVGVWWNMITGRWSWATGADHGATTEHVKQYIDFAAANDINGVLVEGWNVGWDGDWMGHGGDFDFTQPTDDFDIATLTDYARAHDVRLIGHHETGGDIGNYEAQLDAAFAYAAAHDERVVKTGYVTDAGNLVHGADAEPAREWHDGQYRVAHDLRVLKAAAKHQVAVDTHEPVKPTGLRRTYPNAVAREGARGMEYNAWVAGTPPAAGFDAHYNGKNPPDHAVNLVFTRMLAGPMDFTPGLVSLTGADDSPIPSTLAKQLALYVVLYSPFQMAADTPQAYAKTPEALGFIRDVPTDWVDTRVLSGALGEHVVFARRARDSRDWYIGGVTDEQAREVTIALDFLDADTRYRAKIYQDGPEATFANAHRHDMTVASRDVRADQHLTLAMAPGGGQAIKLVAQPSQRRSAE